MKAIPLFACMTAGAAQEVAFKETIIKNAVCLTTGVCQGGATTNCVDKNLDGICDESRP